MHSRATVRQEQEAAQATSMRLCLHVVQYQQRRRCHGQRCRCYGQLGRSYSNTVDVIAYIAFELGMMVRIGGFPYYLRVRPGAPASSPKNSCSYPILEA
jgi:hypothetical protein